MGAFSQVVLNTAMIAKNQQQSKSQTEAPIKAFL
jgi:hypothetical protein